MYHSNSHHYGHFRCPVCNRGHNNLALMHTYLTVWAGAPDDFLGWALCPRDEELAGMGFVALVEVNDEPEGTTPVEQLDNAERTGNVFHVLRDRWESLFLAPPPHMPMQFITADASSDARESNRLNLH